jgi:hypothetical protein
MAAAGALCIQPTLMTAISGGSSLACCAEAYYTREECSGGHCQLSGLRSPFSGPGQLERGSTIRGPPDLAYWPDGAELQTAKLKSRCLLM